MAAAHQKIIDEYVAQGWEAIYPDGSSETHPEACMVGGFGVFFGDHRDTTQCIPVHQKQTNNRGELLAAIHAIRHRTAHKRTLTRNWSSWGLQAKPANGGATTGRAHEVRWGMWTCGSNCSRKLNRPVQQCAGCTSPPMLVLWATHTLAHWLTWGAENPPFSEAMSPQLDAHRWRDRHRNRKRSQTWMNPPCFLRKSGQQIRRRAAAPPPPRAAKRTGSHTVVGS